MTRISCIYAVSIVVHPVSNLFYHSHKCTELIFINEGYGKVFSNDTCFSYTPGKVIVYQPGVSHADHAESAGIQFCIGIQGGGAEKIPVGVWNSTEAIRSLIQRIQTLLDNQGNIDQSLDMDILAGMLSLELRFCLNKQSANESTEDISDYCEKAKMILDAHVEKPYNVEQLAKNIFVSKSYLRKLFKERYGESPLSYLLRKKLDLAEELLQMTTLSVSEIAKKIGISNCFYFSSLFKRKKGVSPAIYRKQYLLKSQKE